MFFIFPSCWFLEFAISVASSTPVAGDFYPLSSHYTVRFPDQNVQILFKFNRKKFESSLRISPYIDLHKVKLNLYGNNDMGVPTSLRQSVTEFHKTKGVILSYPRQWCLIQNPLLLKLISIIKEN